MSSSKLSRYCEGVMEAVWLAALIVTPVFFNLYSSRIFEPDKAALLRSLALIALGAWAVKLVDQGGFGRGGARREGRGWRHAFRNVPLLWQVAFLVGAILVSTVFSVAPRVSFWGSYQRMQGTYTTLAYVIIFACLAAHMRRREQVNRLVLTVILASLPVGLYGILQRLQIDPIPWGGDVSRRIAANMGNSIFVSAYLILAFPLTLGKTVEAFTAILRDEGGAWRHMARATVFVSAIAVQLIALYLSGSRGPFLGWLAGLLAMALLLSLYWNRRGLTIGIMAVGGLVLAFLIVFNIPNGPLAALQSQAGLGRLGKVFEVDAGTGRVRVLIWQGAAELVAPHAPLEYPDGTKDRFNWLRPLIGYGPESMYVAYNPFYPLELANLESRNASPDRSHNETWDALVMTGGLGLAAYLLLFISIFYYGLRWLRMINTPRQRNLFLGLVLGCGAASAAGFIAWGGVGLFGVGFPYGMLAGLGLYLALISLFARYEPPQSDGARLRALTLTMFLSAIIAHFAEIHLGIAIVATRTYFWAYLGVFLAVGHLMAPETGPASPEADQPPEDKPSRKKPKRARRGRASGGNGQPLPWQQTAIAGGMIAAILLSTLGFGFVTNAARSLSPGEILWTSLTTLPNQGSRTSFGILGIILTVWLAAGTLFSAENPAVTRRNWLPALAVVLGVSGGLGGMYGLIHAGGLVGLVRLAASFQQASGGLITLESVNAHAEQLEGLLAAFYVFLSGLVLGLGWFVAGGPARDAVQRDASLAALLVIAVVVPLLITHTNLRAIQADIAFKMAEPLARGNDPSQWEFAIQLYQRARRNAPAEDHYYLFLGQAYLERVRLLRESQPAEAQQLMEQARRDLELAQAINPLNTDHTANLARLHRFWLSVETDPARQQEHALQASEYYARALTLSPNNVVLWNEWALLHLEVLGEAARAEELLRHSLSLDPELFSTYALLGQLYGRAARQAEAEAARETAYQQALANYREAMSRIKRTRDQPARFSYLLEIASLQTDLEKLPQAIATFEEALPLAGTQAWSVENALAQLYFELGEKQRALDYAQAALSKAPDSQKANIQQLISLIEAQN